MSAKLVGDAEMTISVHILFFGFTVGFDVHEEFDVSAATTRSPAAASMRTAAGRTALAGPTPTQPPREPTDNTFGIVHEAADWEAYCTSFALIGVEGA